MSLRNDVISPVSPALAARLTEAVRTAELAAEGEMLGSVLVLDGKRLLLGAAPSLADAYNAEIHGIEIGPAVGSCGTAAYYAEPVFVNDIKSDPLWIDFRDLALEHGLRACWSVPIIGSKGQVLGTFASYYREPRHPQPGDYDVVAAAARRLAPIIEGDAGA